MKSTNEAKSIEQVELMENKLKPIEQRENSIIEIVFFPVVKIKLVDDVKVVEENPIVLFWLVDDDDSLMKTFSVVDGPVVDGPVVDDSVVESWTFIWLVRVDVR